MSDGRREFVALVNVIHPIIEGQVRSFARAHPVVVEAVDWYKPRGDKEQTLVNSLTKRVSRALLCPETVARLRSALNSGDNGAEGN